MRKFFVAVLLIAGGLGGAVALADQSPQAARQLVIQTSERMLAALKANHAQIQAHPDKIYPLVHQIVLPHFDFQTMSQWVLGSYWRTAKPAQRTRFVTAFRDLLIRTYASSLAQYTDQRVVYLPLHAEPKASDVTVRTEIEQRGGPPIPVDYRMHVKDGGWKVYDVTIDNVSLVTNYRSTFAAEIRRHGLDALIKRLSAQNPQARSSG